MKFSFLYTFQLFTAILLVSSVSVAQSLERNKVKDHNSKVISLDSSLKKAENENDKKAIKEKIYTSLVSRAKDLKNLMLIDPKGAVELSLPRDLRDSILSNIPSASKLLEKNVKLTGELEVIIEDGADLKSHKMVFKFHANKETRDLSIDKDKAHHLQSGPKSIQGIELDGLTAVDSMQDSTAATTSSTTVTCGPKGAQRILSILVNLPSYKLPAAVSPDLVIGHLLGNDFSVVDQTVNRSVDLFWRQSSEGQTFVDTGSTVLGPIELSSDFNKDATGNSYCDYYALSNAAMAAVDASVDFRRYTRVQFILPPNGACGWAGVANVGCRSLSSNDGSFTASLSWNRADTMQSRDKAVQLSTHELGHNLGLGHASTRSFHPETLGNIGVQGSLNEYGDNYSTMGGWCYGFYAASQTANQLGWIDTTKYRTIESNGSFSLKAYEISTRTDLPKALKIRRGTGNEAWLWIEARKNNSAEFPNAGAFVNGALIRYQDSITGGKSHLLDFNPGTTAYSDAALNLGQSWKDPYSNLEIAVIGSTSDTLDISVNYGALPCVISAPTLTLSPSTLNLEKGASGNFSVSVKNNNSVGCGGSYFDLTSTIPSGLTGAFSNSALLVDPGATLQSSLSVTSSLSTTPASYSVTAKAQDRSPAGLSASGSGVVNVTEPVNTLALSITGRGVIAYSSPSKSCSTSCSTDYTSATSVTLTATASTGYIFGGWAGACSGTSTQCTLTVDKDLSVSATFKKSSGGSKPRR